MISANGLIQLGYEPEVDFVLEDIGNGVYIKEWNHSDAQPTEAEITTADAEWHTENDYKFERKLEYPDIGDQLDMLWHAIDSGSLDKTSDFYLALKAVKDNNPKPNREL